MMKLGSHAPLAKKQMMLKEECVWSVQAGADGVPFCSVLVITLLFPQRLFHTSCAFRCINTGQDVAIPQSVQSLGYEDRMAFRQHARLLSNAQSPLSAAQFLIEELRPKSWENEAVFVQNKPYFAIYMVNPMSDPVSMGDLVASFAHLVSIIPPFARHLLVLQV